MLKPYNN